MQYSNFMWFLLLFSLLGKAEQIKVAVIDSGIDLNYINEFNLCSNGLKDFTGTGIHDTMGHGTNVAGLIKKYNKNPEVCYIFIKAFTFQGTADMLVQAIMYAMNQGVQVINYSGGGPDPSVSEQQAVKLFLKHGGIFITSVGNNKADLDRNCNYFPACYDKKIFTVSNNKPYSSKYSNSTKLTLDGEGEAVLGRETHGTSQSTAIFTGLFLTYLKDKNIWTH